MDIRLPIVSLCLLVTGFHCGTITSNRSVTPREALATVRSFAVQFSGDYRLSTFSRYNLVIIDPDHSQHAEADSLSQRHVLPIAYVNIGEAEEYRWYYSAIQPAWVLGKNPNWDRHFYLDVNNEGWQNLVLNKILPRVYQHEYAGIFLDMIDIASPELFPATRPGVIRLIARIRAAYPDKLIFLNNGVFLAGDAAENIDAICVESVFATYDFDTKTYVVRPQEESGARARELRELQARLKTRILVIDYAAPGDRKTRALVESKCAEYGFIPFVSTIDLNALDTPPPTSDGPGR